MHYFEWLPIYRWIARRLNLSVAEDQRVARLLVQLVKRPASPTALAAAIAGQTVTIVGAGPSLSSIDPRWLEGTVIAADGAA
ncbi:hypothetical protein DRN94_002830, partial [archaeon]|nr:hypothetical protein [archaeon]